VSNIIFILSIIGTVVIPLVALLFAWRGIKAWQIDKTLHIYSNIQFKAERISGYNDDSKISFEDLCVSLLDELEILAILIEKKYVFIDDELKAQIFNTYIKHCYENKHMKLLIDNKRENNSNAYYYIGELYKIWNKK